MCNLLLIQIVEMHRLCSSVSFLVFRAGRKLQMLQLRTYCGPVWQKVQRIRLVSASV